MVSRGDTALALSEWVEAEDHESDSRHIDAERLKIRTGLAVRPPVPVVEQDRRRGRAELVGKIEMRRRPGSGQCLKNDFLDPKSIARNCTGDCGLQVRWPRQRAKAERLFQALA